MAGTSPIDWVYKDTWQGFAVFYTMIHNRPPPDIAVDWIKSIYENKSAVIEAFRGSTKTTTFVTFVAYRIGLEPHKSNLIIQVSDESAKKNAGAIADIIEHNDAWKALFPNVVPDKPAGWGGGGYEVKDTSVASYEEWRRKNATRRDPTVVGLGRTSNAIIGKHPDGVCLIDDIDDEITTRSERERLKTNKILTGTIFPTFTPETWKVVIGTPWTYNDSISYVKSTKSFVEVSTPGRNKKGEPVWPEERGEEWLEEQRKLLGEIEFARMIMLDLEAAKGHVLKREWISYFPFEDIRGDWPRFMGIDFASTQDQIRVGAERDDFCAVWGAVTPNGSLIIEDGILAQLSQGEAEQKIIGLVGMMPTLKQIGVESIGKGEEFYTLLMRAPMFMPLMPIPSHRGMARSKGGRFQKVLAPAFEYGRVMLSSRDTKFTKAFIDQWVSWDGTDAVKDDALDGVFMLMKASEGFIHIPQLQTVEVASPLYKKRVKSVNPWSGLKNA